MSNRFIKGLGQIPKARLFGVPEFNEDRGPTFALSLDGHNPDTVATHLATRGVYVWSGHYYAVNVMRQLGVLDQGGLVRIGFVHYNTEDEVDRALEALTEI